jgi:hypothetical protein
MVRRQDGRLTTEYCRQNVKLVATPYQGKIVIKPLGMDFIKV